MPLEKGKSSRYRISICYTHGRTPPSPKSMLHAFCLNYRTSLQVSFFTMITYLFFSFVFLSFLFFLFQCEFCTNEKLFELILQIHTCL